MGAARIAIGCIALTLLWAGAASAQEPCTAPAPCIGRVIIVGNTITRDDVIRGPLGLMPGQTFEPADLRQAERRLARLGIFETDPKKGIRPSVTAIATDDPAIFDILVRVKETLTGTLKLGVALSSNGRMVLQFRVEERNFDPRRWPTSFEDFAEGKAFRGGGQRLRVTWTLGSR